MVCSAWRTAYRCRVSRLAYGVSCGTAWYSLSTASLRTKILDFRGFDSSRILMLRVEFSCPWGFHRKFESRNLSRENRSREIGRSSSPKSGAARYRLAREEEITLSLTDGVQTLQMARRHRQQHHRQQHHRHRITDSTSGSTTGGTTTGSTGRGITTGNTADAGAEGRSRSLVCLGVRRRARARACGSSSAQHRSAQEPRRLVSSGGERTPNLPTKIIPSKIC